MTYEITIEGETHLVTVEPGPNCHMSVRWTGENHVVDVLRPSAEAFQMLIDGESWEAGAVASGDGYLVDVMGVAVQVDVVDPRRKALKHAAGGTSGTLATMMPGRVVKVFVKAGDAVRKGQPLVVIEAMKMENEMKAAADGTVVEVLVSEGQAVEAGTKLVRIEGQA
jgi:biotin carboxyl carrier protein